MKLPNSIHQRCRLAVRVGSLATIFLFAIVQLACVRSSPVTETSSPSTQVAELIVEARKLWSTRRAAALLESLEQFELATTLGPSSAEAWAGVADASALIGLYSLVPPAQTMPRALDAAKRALELDPRQGTTWASLGLVQYLFEWNFEDAEASLSHALELDPLNHDAHHWLAMMLSVLGRHTEATQHIETAAALKPDSPLLTTKVGTIQAAAGQLEQAQRSLESALQRFPDFALAHRELAFVYLRQRHFDAAAASFRMSLGLSAENLLSQSDRSWFADGNPKTLGALAHTLGRQGKRSGADEILRTLLARSKAEYIPAMVIAHAQLGAGQLEQARLQLKKALNEREPGLVYIRTKAGFELLPAAQLDRIVKNIGPLSVFAPH